MTRRIRNNRDKVASVLQGSEPAYNPTLGLLMTALAVLLALMVGFAMLSTVMKRNPGVGFRGSPQAMQPAGAHGDSVTRDAL